MRAKRPSGPWSWGFFVFTLLWGGFALTWSGTTLSRGRFLYGRQPAVLVRPDRHPWVFWAGVIGVAVAGLVVLSLGIYSLVLHYRARAAEKLAKE